MEETEGYSDLFRALRALKDRQASQLSLLKADAENELNRGKYEALWKHCLTCVEEYHQQQNIIARQIISVCIVE